MPNDAALMETFCEISVLEARLKELYRRFDEIPLDDEMLDERWQELKDYERLGYN